MSKFTDRFKTRPLSYSQLSSFEYSPEDWYRRYILNEKVLPNASMQFGTFVGDLVGTPQSPIPCLENIGVKEYELRGNIGSIHMIGFCDGYDPVTKVLYENKTTDKPNKWNQKSVDEHSQLTMYALLLFLQDKTPPESVTMYLNYIPVEVGGDFQYRLPDPPTYVQIPTKRTTLDILRYTQYVEQTVEKMKEYAISKGYVEE